MRAAGSSRTRVLDCALALLGLVGLAPLLAAAAAGIRLSGPGPVVYRAQRAGQGGTPFIMYKLRTMRVGAAEAGRITGGRDLRVLPAGQLLRRFKLDELPQLWNVVRGEMALVGPRPEDVDIVREHYDDFMWETLTVPPGVTSPGSLHYYADEASIPSDPAEAERLYLDELLPRKLALDLVYVRNRSVSYHLEILLRTCLGIVGLGGLFSYRMDWERETAALYLAERATAP